MSKKQLPFFIFAAAALFALLIYFFGGSDGRPVYSWQEHYEPGSKDPYGTYLMRNLLETYNADQPFLVVEDSLSERLDSGNYVYVGTDFWLDSLSMQRLLRFVEQGNRAFIACPYIPSALLDSISRGECLIFTDYDDSFTAFKFNDTLALLNFQHPSLHDSSGYTYQFQVFRAPTFYDWAYLSEALFCDSQTVFASLGLINEQYTNFTSARYGGGEFLFHTTPLAFTNLHLVDKRGLEYASKAFSHLKSGPIYWDESRSAPFGDMAGGNGIDRNSPLRYILTQPSLAWAWYILLGMAVLYLLFRAKRRQRMIPVLERNTNTSLEFIGTIGRLFFIQNNHRQLAAQQMRLFLVFVRERYHLPTKELNEQFRKGLAVRSSVAEEHIAKIINLHRNISNSGFLSEATMVDFHRLMERFYRDCK